MNMKGTSRKKMVREGEESMKDLIEKLSKQELMENTGAEFRT